MKGIRSNLDHEYRGETPQRDKVECPRRGNTLFVAQRALPRHDYSPSIGVPGKPKAQPCG